MIYDYSIAGIAVRTGDIICTTDGNDRSVVGQMWKTLGYLVPGEIDHLALYIGPGGRCVEAGARGVITFEVPEGHWDAERMAGQRWLIDTLVGVAYPLAGRGLGAEQERRIRLGVADYCIAQAGTPYNINFFDPATDAAFYCSQLIYKAYLDHGINLNPERLYPPIFRGNDIVFPQEIWQHSHHVRQQRAPGGP